MQPVKGWKRGNTNDKKRSDEDSQQLVTNSSWEPKIGSSVSFTKHDEQLEPEIGSSARLDELRTEPPPSSVPSDGVASTVSDEQSIASKKIDKVAALKPVAKKQVTPRPLGSENNGNTPG